MNDKPSKKLSLSVVIPTFGRKTELINTVSALLTLADLPDEIVVVDQNFPEIPEITSFMKSSPLVKHVKHSKTGLIANYNKCLREARGDIVLFLDDDIIPCKNLVAAHRGNYELLVEEGLPIGGVAGRIWNADDPHKSGQSRVGHYNRITGRVVGGFNSRKRSDVEFGQGANMSFLREALIRAGGFDKAFDGNGYFFETEAGLRVCKLGYRLVFDPEAEVEHLIANTGGARITNKAIHTLHYVKNGIKLYRRHSSQVGLPFFTAKQLMYVSAKAIYNRDSEIFIKGLLGIGRGLLSPMEYPEL